MQVEYSEVFLFTAGRGRLELSPNKRGGSLFREYVQE